MPQYLFRIFIFIIFVIYFFVIWNNLSDTESRFHHQKSEQTSEKESIIFYPNYEYNSVENNFTPAENKSRYFRININSSAIPFIDSQKDIHSIPMSQFDIVLLWTRYYRWSFLNADDDNADNFRYDIKKVFHRPAHCMDLYPNCRLTANRKYYNQSTMIIFHWRNLNLRDLPSYRFSNQIWQLFNQESPMSSPYFSNQVHVEFNSIAFYHSISDMRLPYGETERFENASYEPDIGEKTLPAIWMVTHCDTASKRELYTVQLKIYIPIDIYGSCGIYNLCNKKDFAECQHRLFKKYYFYLSFENSFCDEYATEKLFVAMQRDIVPIVFGAANYSAILPPHSFIDATKYRPEKLAEYMKYLMSNRTAYLEYFHWKRHFKVQGDRNPLDHLYCEACRYAQQYKRGNIRRKTITLEQINQFWFSTCWDSSLVDKVVSGT